MVSLRDVDDLSDGVVPGSSHVVDLNSEAVESYEPDAEEAVIFDPESGCVVPATYERVSALNARYRESDGVKLKRLKKVPEFRELYDGIFRLAVEKGAGSSDVLNRLMSLKGDQSLVGKAAYDDAREAVKSRNKGRMGLIRGRHGRTIRDGDRRYGRKVSGPVSSNEDSDAVMSKEELDRRLGKSVAELDQDKVLDSDALDNIVDGVSDAVDSGKALGSVLESRCWGGNDGVSVTDETSDTSDSVSESKSGLNVGSSDDVVLKSLERAASGMRGSVRSVGSVDGVSGGRRKYAFGSEAVDDVSDDAVDGSEKCGGPASGKSLKHIVENGFGSSGGRGRKRKYRYFSVNGVQEEERRRKVRSASQLAAEKVRFNDATVTGLGVAKMVRRFLERVESENGKRDDGCKDSEGGSSGPVWSGDLRDRKEWYETVVSPLKSGNGFCLPDEGKDYPALYRQGVDGSVMDVDRGREAYVRSREFVRVDGSLSPDEDVKSLFEAAFGDSDVYVCSSPLPVLYRHARSIALSGNAPKGTGKVDMIVSLDTEYERATDVAESGSVVGTSEGGNGSGLLAGLASLSENAGGSDGKPDDAVHGRNVSASYQVTCAASNGSLFQFLVVTRDGFRMRSTALVDVCQYLATGEYDRCNWACLVTGHFFSAEWSMMADRLELSKYFTDIRKCAVTKSPQGYCFKIRNSGGRYRNFRVMVADSYLASPAKFSSLKSWGQALGFPKIELAPGVIEKMVGLFRDDLPAAAQYAMRDTEIPLMILSRYYQMCGDLGFCAGKTLGASTVNYIKALTTDEAGSGRGGWTVTDSSGKETESFRYSSERVLNEVFTGHRKVGRGGYTLKESRSIGDSFASECFHGGFNAVDYHGTIEAGKGQRLIDCDLKSAYSVILGSIPFIDFDAVPSVLMPRDTSDEEQAYLMKSLRRSVSEGLPVVVMCSFSSREGTAFHENPCLPVRSDTGLQYIREGKSFCTGAEILVADEMGGIINLEAVQVWKAGYRKGGTRGLYTEVISSLVRKRFECDHERNRILSEHGGEGSLPLEVAEQVSCLAIRSAYMKELVNSLYGKVAQAVSDRTVSGFSPFAADHESKMLDPSAVTLPIAASVTTGYIRACVHSMNHCFRQNGYQVLSSTTDGSLVLGPDISNDELHEMLEGSFCSRTLRHGQEFLGTSGERIYEIKHSGDRAILRRTRAYTLYDGEKPVMIAKGGLKIDGSNEEIAATLEALDREDAVVMREETRLASIKDIAWRRADDLVSVVTRKRAHNDYDFKRELLSSGYTVPWNTIDDYRMARFNADLCHKSGIRASYTHMAMRRSGLMVSRTYREAFNYVVRCFAAFGLHGWTFHSDSVSDAFYCGRVVISRVRRSCCQNMMKKSSRHGNTTPLNIMGLEDVINGVDTSPEKLEELTRRVIAAIPRLPRTVQIINELNALIDTMTVEGVPVSKETREEMLMAVTEDDGSTPEFDLEGNRIVYDWNRDYKLPPAKGVSFSFNEKRELVWSLESDGRRRRIVQQKVGNRKGADKARKAIKAMEEFARNEAESREWDRTKRRLVNQRAKLLEQAAKMAAKDMKMGTDGDLFEKARNRRFLGKFIRNIASHANDLLRKRAEENLETIRNGMKNINDPDALKRAQGLLDASLDRVVVEIAAEDIRVMERQKRKEAIDELIKAGKLPPSARRNGARKRKPGAGKS